MAAYHPQIVHFAIALLAVGVLFRVVSLLGRPVFLGPAAATLLLLGTAAAVLAAASGDAAHEPVERMPGLRAAVVEHEAWGSRTRTTFVAVAAIEVVALLLARLPKRRYLLTASAVVGLGGLFCLYEAAEHGGRLVYAYAGGVGIRRGDPADVGRLLLAGLYHEAQRERQAGRPEEASALLVQAGRRFPNEVEVQLAVAESWLVDRKEPSAALATLRGMALSRDDRALRIRHGLLTTDALEAAGQRDGAIAVVQALATEYPDVPRLKQRIEQLQSQSPQ